MLISCTIDKQFPLTRFPIIAVDPSVNTVGVACLYEGELSLRQINVPKEVKERGMADVGKHITDSIVLHFSAAVKHAIYILEYPQFQTSTRGEIAAQKGYTLDLAFICGQVAALSIYNRVYLWTPTQWKGQQPKKAIEVKFNEWAEVDAEAEGISDHCYESAMMVKRFLLKHPHHCK